MDKLLQEFRESVCDRWEQIDEAEARDWYDLSYGWFLARGCSIKKAHELAREARYTYRYWRRAAQSAGKPFLGYKKTPKNSLE